MQLERWKWCKREIVDKISIFDQISFVDLRIKTGITVIVCGFSSRGVYFDVEQITILTISGDRSSFEEGEAIVGLKGRHLARGKFGKKFGSLVRGIVYVVARLVESEAANGGDRFDLSRSRDRVSNQVGRTGCGEIDVREGLSLAVQNRRRECQSTFFGWGTELVEVKWRHGFLSTTKCLPPASLTSLK